jgi:hypothetical protein
LSSHGYDNKTLCTTLKLVMTIFQTAARTSV